MLRQLGPRAPSRRPGEIPERELSAEIEFYPSYAVFKERAGTICGADRVRTDDIQLAKLALSQLSYSPRKRKEWFATHPPNVEERQWA